MMDIMPNSVEVSQSKEAERINADFIMMKTTDFKKNVLSRLKNNNEEAFEFLDKQIEDGISQEPVMVIIDGGNSKGQKKYEALVDKNGKLIVRDLAKRQPKKELIKMWISKFIRNINLTMKLEVS